SFQPFQPPLSGKLQELRIFDVLEPEAARAAARFVVTAQAVPFTLSEGFPEQLKLFIEFISNACGAAARAVVGDANFSRVFDNAARIEMSELNRDTPYKVP